jgi:formamidopyrimidine-DNA glycosylase
VPELLEIERYWQAADAVVGRTIATVDAPDAWFVKGGLGAGALAEVLPGHRVVGTRRIGKLLLLDLAGTPPLGLRFGMTGRLVVDGTASIDQLEYASGRDLPEWDRFTLHFAGGTALRINDPRRLGGVELGPDESRLGPDAATITLRQLTGALEGSTAPLKARLLDQRRVAGLGNLLVDEILYTAGLDPARTAGSLDAGERKRLRQHVVATVARLGARGGSHMGDLQSARVRGGRCPRDGAELLRRTVGGRTTYSCPIHQS